MTPFQQGWVDPAPVAPRPDAGAPPMPPAPSLATGRRDSRPRHRVVKIIGYTVLVLWIGNAIGGAVTYAVIHPSVTKARQQRDSAVGTAVSQQRQLDQISADLATARKDVQAATAARASCSATARAVSDITVRWSTFMLATEKLATMPGGSDQAAALESQVEQDFTALGDAVSAAGKTAASCPR